MADEPKVKCKGCGFLSKHAHGFERPLPVRYFEIDEPERDRPSLFFRHLSDPFLGEINTELACFVGAADFRKEIGDTTNTSERNSLALYAIGCERACARFYPHKAGFSPMDHFLWYQEERQEQERAKFAQWMENGRRDFEEKLSKRQEEFETALALKDESLQTQRDLTATASNRVMTRLTIAAVVFAAAQVLTLTRESLLAKAALWAWHYIFG